MMDIITGKTKPQSGRVFFGSTIDLLRYSEPEIAKLGIGRKFQKPTVFEYLSVWENLELALKTDKGVAASICFKLTHEQKDRLFEVIETIQLQEDLNRQAGNLSHGQKQWLEIGMVILQDPLLLLVDEPVAGMTDKETEQTGILLQTLAEKHAVIVIEHDMEFVRQIARTVTVLHEGAVICEGPVEKVQADDRVREIYLGRQKVAYT
jgi:urea transport system ATP-binding protein